jgi:signal transduction histidine kinase
LQEALIEFERTQAALAGLGLTEAQKETLESLRHRAREQAAKPPELDALARSDQEYALESWLDQHGIEQAWVCAPTLVNLAFEEGELTTLAEGFRLEQINGVIMWLNAIYNTYSLLSEISQGASRISEIVKALKSYSYLDQAPVQTVDVHEGLDDTLLILRHKLKTGINVRREYVSDLPTIQAYGSELNQVWTNIIDNAADALNGQGEITLRTRQEGDWVIVEIEDNGPGIPPEVKPRLFDPFFTTKPPGKGTGLGLDISYRIIVHKHQGDIKVYSKPGRTRFEVWLPTQLKVD